MPIELHLFIRFTRLQIIFNSIFKKRVQMLTMSAAERNKEPILNAVRGYLTRQGDSPEQLKALEIASGAGQHLTHFAAHLPHVSWYPSDIEPRYLKSISAHKEAKGLKNVCQPIMLDMMNPALSEKRSLELESFDMVYNANMIHISPWETSLGLFHTAGKVLKHKGILFMYGPFRMNGILTPDSNVRFDAGLKREDPSWGIRDTEDLKKLAAENGLSYEHMIDMPANNKCLIFRKGG